MTMTRQLRFWMVGLLAFCLLVWLLSDILMPFVAAMAIAYLLDPLADKLEARGMSRTWAVITLTCAATLVLAAVLLIVVPVAAEQVSALISRLPHYLDQLAERIRPLLDELRALSPEGQTSGLTEAAKGGVGGVIGWIGKLFAGLWSGGMVVFNVVSLVLLTPVIAFYLLRDWDKLTATVDGWLPRQHRATIRRLLREIDESLAGMVRGQALVISILATFYATALSIVGLEFGLAIGLIAGSISFIPFLGALTGLVLSVGVALVQFWPDPWPIAIVVAIYAAGQAAEGNVLTPRLVGERIGLHPVWVIFAVLAGGALFGFTGVLLALPASTAIAVLVRFLLERYLASRYYDPSLPEIDFDPEDATSADGDSAAGS
jgi:predicted PurR-regulated permease PerM